jgi:hypothetical protein
MKTSAAMKQATTCTDTKQATTRKEGNQEKPKKLKAD